MHLIRQLHVALTRQQSTYAAMTLTVHVEIMGTDRNDESPAVAEEAVVSSPTETVTWMWEDSPDSHWDDVVEVLDTTLASALAGFTTGPG